MREAIDYFLWENSRREMGDLRYCRAVILVTGDRDFAREIRNIKRYMIGAERGGKQGASLSLLPCNACRRLLSLAIPHPKNTDTQYSPRPCLIAPRSVCSLTPSGT